MKKFWKFSIITLGLLTGMTSATAVDKTDHYAIGQVWNYKTRPQDRGSTLKIQAIESLGVSGQNVYHVSLIGVKIGKDNPQTVLQHIPVSKTTLDQSVTSLHQGPAEFPSAQEGISVWREDQGGVFTVSIADIVDIIDKAIS